jgi:hypothetical protein
MVSTFADLDLLAFVRYLYNSGAFNSSEYPVGVQIRFKAHSSHIIY